jgi:DNA-directed RNA polymerase specialized sigma24 family protein
MLSRALTWRDDMTREELDETFTKYYEELVRAAQRRCKVVDDARDLVNTLFIRAASGTEYLGVPHQHIRKWWHFRLRDFIGVDTKRQGRVRVAEERFHSNIGEQVDIELTEAAGKALVEGYWSSLTAVQKTRLRQRYQEEGIPLLPFMKPQRKGG